MILKGFVKTGELHFEHNGCMVNVCDLKEIDVPHEEINDVLTDIISNYYDIPKGAKMTVREFIAKLNQNDGLAELYRDELKEHYFDDWNE